MKVTLSVISNSENTFNAIELPNDIGGYNVSLEYLNEKDPNVGLKNASGDYVIFLDKHDELNEFGLICMLREAITSESEVIIGATYRKDIGVVWNEDKLFNGRKINTNIKETPLIIYDTMVSNKMFKKSFLLDNSLNYNVENKYNHHLFTIQSFVLSDKITIIPEIVCYWGNRRKVKGKKSNRLDASDLDQRLEILKQIDHLFNLYFPPEYITVKNERFLKRDLLVYINDVLYGEDEHITHVLSSIKEYINDLDFSILKNLKALDRLKYYLIKHDMTNELLYLLRYQKEAFLPSTIEFENKVYSNLPYFMDKEYNIPLELYELTNELQVVTEIKSVRLDGYKLYLNGLAHFNYLDFRENDNIQKGLLLKSRLSQKEYYYPLGNKKVDESILEIGNGYYYYLNAGFEEHINLTNIQNILAEEICDVYIYLKFQDRIKSAYVFTIDQNMRFNHLIIEDSMKPKYDLYMNNVGFPSMVNEISSFENESLLFSGNSYVGFNELDEEHYFIRNLIIHNKVTNERHRMGVHSRILNEEKVLEMKNGLSIKIRLEYQSYIPINYHSGIWDIKLGTREADSFEIISPIDSLIYEHNDVNFQISHHNYYLSFINLPDNKVLLSYFNKNQQKDLNLERKIQNVNGQLNKLKKKIQYMENSFSWKITKPIRLIKKLLSKI